MLSKQRKERPLKVKPTAATTLGGFAARSFLQGQPTVLPVLTKELTSYRDIVKQVLPAVVSIEARKKAVKGRRGPDFDPSVPEEVRKFFEGMQPQFGEE